MKQKGVITITMNVDEDNENANFDYIQEVACEMLRIAQQDDYKARVDVDLE